MKFIVHKDTTTIISDCIVVFCGLERQLFPLGKSVDKNTEYLLSDIASSQGFEGKAGSLFHIHTHTSVSKKNTRQTILVVGVGDTKKLTMHTWLDSIALVSREVKKMRIKTISIMVESQIISELGEEAAEGIVEGMILGAYTFNRYKKMEKEEHLVDTVHIVSSTETDILEKAIQRAEMISRGVILARDLVNEPSSVTTPTFLSLVAMDIAKKSPSITCQVYEKKDLEAFTMGGILGIAKGSDEDPKLIKLTYNGGGNKTIAIVGKGVTFDSGGLSLKSQDGMETMKIDMAGAASVLGIFSVLSELKLNINVIGVIPAVENMPSGSAIKPGDVVKAYNGKTIEIISTDAEGRVILADALSWITKNEKLNAVIDLATLTGACMIALGEDIAGVFSNTTSLSESIIRSSRETGEAVWELPLYEGYADLLKSDVADIRNVTRKRYGGAITAGLFLQAFVPDGIPFAHIDIAGPAISEKDTPFMPVGGTGFGVRLMISYLQNLIGEADRKMQ
jgi:leucyl aminopeptidase